MKFDGYDGPAFGFPLSGDVNSIDWLSRIVVDDPFSYAD